ncbi:DEAD/DEAH box helicase family protein [Bradyrhizobium symbiodeficiens]|uniref:DEAD/DEAH box helicase family protein n=1 Tax=Bradyrhizobium symbiodeficiens TaxID=1404367 RepID=UPI000BA1AF4B|nr:DEAD/DEAH box helicase family protein [Bradyrhizobium symbiodeficiens]AWM10686.1 restriction endonuclease subunit R [Bradyrhizobium symbiodeficiens]
MKEATARIKINKLLEAAQWRFFADSSGPANIQLEPSVALTKHALDDLGENFEKASKGFIDFLLLNEKGFPFIVLEAKAEDKNPLVGKEQARKYAKSQNCRFVILSNGNLHYFWDLERGNPYVITSFPTPASVVGYQKSVPDPKRLIEEVVGNDYVVLTQRPNYATEAAWKSEAERPRYIELNGLRFLRPYQQRAIVAIQQTVMKGGDRFLLEMATGTGKTLTSAAIIKLFLRTGNARRVLFLVDRLELEDQALKAFRKILANDYKSVIYKESRDDWRHAEVVVSTVQSLLFNNKYNQLFSPTDFDLVISDEAHRSIGGNARAVFDYFIGYKLGLTATPRDYLKKFAKDKPTSKDPREFERRVLLDTYRTFGCEDGQPTFRYSLLDGVKDGYLVNPTVVDARSEVTTQLLSDGGFVVEFKDEEGEDQKEAYKQREFEKRFFSVTTNQLFCRAFLENALRDPVSGEIGKSIIFAVSQNHAAKLAQILNGMADRIFPGKYQSDFAVQVTSHVGDAQQYTVNFANNNLLGSANFIPSYKTSKARVCITVGMMTTGYDCPDILNLGLFRPVFSPTDFIQIKGRGTRKHDFREQLFDETIRESVKEPHKAGFKLFDFFANCEYFEEKFDYDQIIKLPRAISGTDETGGEPGGGSSTVGIYEHLDDDILLTLKEEDIGHGGMRIDREFYAKFEDVVRENFFVAASVEAGEWDRVIDYLNREIFDKPSEYYSLEKLRKAAGVDRRLTLREILEKIFGLIPRFKSRDDLLEEEFSKFVADYKPDEATAIPAIKNYFKAYAASDQIRYIIESGQLTDLATNPIFSTREFKAVPAKYRKLIPEYVKDYVSLNQFVT